MTARKQISDKYRSILENETMKIIMDRAEPIEPVIESVMASWNYDLFTRRPGPAYIDDEFIGTDLDMATFLFALHDRHAVINITKYKSMRAGATRADEELTSKENRHGELVGLTSNKDTFVFSVKIKDLNVRGENTVGAFRNFALTQFDGTWYPGWDKIEFDPTRKENRFITENELWSGHTIYFKNFVHPNRWISVFGEPYFITKALIDRLRDESQVLYQTIKGMKAAGIVDREEKEPIEYVPSDKDTKKVEAPAFHLEIDIPENDTRYKSYDYTEDTLIECKHKRNYYTYSVIPKLQFITRGIELAHFKYPNMFPMWLKNVKWEPYMVKRTAWERLVLFQHKVGEKSIALRRRFFTKMETITI